jgi:hypothetical protein
MKSLVLLLAFLPPLACAQPEGLRGACGLFIEQSTGETVRHTDQANWTVIDNRDGTWSVGARHTRAGRDAYTNCIIRPEAGGFKLLKLTRLR